MDVHRGDEPYFEWARVIEALANGCVVASETSVFSASWISNRTSRSTPACTASTTRSTRTSSGSWAVTERTVAGIW